MADDAQGFVIIEGSLTPGQPPVLTQQWLFQGPRSS